MHFNKRIMRSTERQRHCNKNTAALAFRCELGYQGNVSRMATGQVYMALSPAEIGILYGLPD